MLRTLFLAGAVSACVYSGYDLTGLRRAQDLQGAEGIYKYHVNFCGPVVAAGTCKDGSMSVCQYNTDDTFVAGIGSFTLSPAPVSSLLSDGVRIEMVNGDSCYNAGAFYERVLDIDIHCGADSNTFTVSEPQICEFHVDLTSSLVCGGPGGSGGLSGGSVFLILLLVGIVVYVVGGCVYMNKVKGTSGMDSCPHVDFWKGLPSLIKDGCSFTKTKILELKNGKNNSYEDL